MIKFMARIDDKQMDKMADCFEEYLDIIQRYVIITGITEEEYDDAVKKVKKLIKHLRNHDDDKVFDKEALEQAEEEEDWDED